MSIDEMLSEICNGRGCHECPLNRIGKPCYGCYKTSEESKIKITEAYNMLFEPLFELDENDIDAVFTGD